MRPITILLAEDSFGDQGLFKLALQDSVDTHLEIVSDGNEAMQFLGREGKYTEVPIPDLVVLDFNLPKVNGSEILEKLQKHPTLNRLPVAIFSGAKPTEGILNACKHASLYIVKPEGIDKYFAVVKSLEEYCRNVLKAPGLTKKHSQELQRSLEESQHCDVYVPDVVKPGPSQAAA